jgi:hypothetical protein
LKNARLTPPTTSHWAKQALDLSGNSNRAVLREGTFNKLSSRGEIICRRVFLFNDLVLVARVLQTRQCLLKAAIPLARCLLYDCGTQCQTRVSCRVVSFAVCVCGVCGF